MAIDPDVSLADPEVSVASPLVPALTAVAIDNDPDFTCPVPVAMLKSPPALRTSVLSEDPDSIDTDPDCPL
jgi:hypothetical protein